MDNLAKDIYKDEYTRIDMPMEYLMRCKRVIKKRLIQWRKL